MSETTTEPAAIHQDIISGIMLAISGVHSGDATEATLIAKGIIVAIVKREIRHMAIDYTGQPTEKGTLV